MGIKHTNDKNNDITLAAQSNIDDRGMKILEYEVASMKQKHVGDYTCHATSIAGAKLPNAGKRKRKISVTMKGDHHCLEAEGCI